MPTPTFHWSEDSAVIFAGTGRLYLVAVPGNPAWWIVFEGYQRLGAVTRTGEDQTPEGEAIL